MSVFGLVGTPLGYCIQLPARGGSRVLDGQISAFSRTRIFRRNCSPRLLNIHALPRTHMIKCAMDASYGDAMNNQFGHKPSVDVIEAAHNKIIMQSFYDRKRPKLNIKKKVKDVTQSRYVQAVMNRFRTPADSKFILVTSVAFLLLGALTILFPTKEGPTLQVALSLVATMYFIHSRLKSKIRALLYGVGAFIFSWLLGTLLMVSVIPPILKGPRSFEVTTCLITYALLWVPSTYVK